jgi:hypothetical protein
MRVDCDGCQPELSDGVRNYELQRTAISDFGLAHDDRADVRRTDAISMGAVVEGSAASGTCGPALTESRV